MIDLVKLLLFAGDGGDGRVSFRHEKYAPKGGPDGGDGGDGGSIIFRGSRQVSTLQHLAGKASFTAEAGQTGGRKNKTGAKSDSLIVEVPLGTQVIQLAENKTGFKRRMRFSIEQKLPRDAAKRPQYFLEEEGQPIPFREPDYCLPRWKDGVKAEVIEHEDGAVEEPSETELLSLFSQPASDLLQNEHLDKIVLYTFTEEGEELVVCQGGFGARGNVAFKSSTNRIPLQAEYGSFAERRGVLLELKL